MKRGGLLAALLVMGLGAFSVAVSGHKLRELARQRVASHVGPPLSELAPELIDFMTLGHRALYEDFIYLWLLQYLIPERYEIREPLETLRKRIDIVLAQKPRIEAIYLLSCFVLALDYNRPDLCERISTLALQVFPESWRVPMAQGYIFAFPLKKPLQAAFYYHLAASRAASPPFVASLVEKLLRSNEWTPQDRQDVLNSILAIPKSDGFRALLPQTRP